MPLYYWRGGTGAALFGETVFELGRVICLEAVYNVAVAREPWYTRFDFYTINRYWGIFWCLEEKLFRQRIRVT